MTSKGPGESRKKARPHHKTSSHKYQGQTQLSGNAEHQPSNHDAATANILTQHGTQPPSPTPVTKAMDEKPNFAAITTAEWMVHDKIQRWMEEGPAEQPWNSGKASSIETKDQGRDGSGQQDTL